MLRFFGLFGKRTNVDRGKEIEEQFKSERELMGEKVTRTGIGSDYKTERIDILTGKKHVEKWEIKRNNSPLSKRQKKTRGLKVYRSIDTQLGQEVRIEDKHKNRITKNVGGEWTKTKKQEDVFGFGSSGSRRKKSSGYDDMFGF